MTARALTQADEVVRAAPLAGQLDLADELHADALVLELLGGQRRDADLGPGRGVGSK